MKATKNAILGLKQEFSKNIIRSNLKICDLIYHGNYKLSNNLIHQNILLEIMEKNSKIQ